MTVESILLENNKISMEFFSWDVDIIYMYGITFSTFCELSNNLEYTNNQQVFFFLYYNNFVVSKQSLWQQIVMKKIDMVQMSNNVHKCIVHIYEDQAINAVT